MPPSRRAAATRAFASLYLLLVIRPASAGPPAAFVNTAVTSVFGVPTAFAYAPDGRIFITEKSGRVLIVAGGNVSVYLDVTDETNEYGDRGLLGIALDPDFTHDDWVYLFHIVEPAPGDPDSSAPATGEVFRIRSSALDPDVADAASRQTLLAGFDNHYYSHSGGCLRFDADGHLLASFGDGSSYNDVDAFALHSYDLDSLSGKLVRVDRASGDGVPANPYYDALDPAAVHSKVLARGFRNPFRFGIDPSSGDVYVGDVGWNDWEEVNRVPLAWSNADRELNFGWPCYEGAGGVSLHQYGYANDPNTAPACLGIYPPAEGGSGLGASPALYSYDHTGVGADNGTSVTGGVFYAGGGYPAAFAGRYFFADYSRDRFQTLTPDGQVEDFGIPGGWGSPVDIQLAPSGNVVYLGIGDATLHEIVFSITNHAPHAVASATPLNGAAPLRVAFTAVGSFDPDKKDRINYKWDFGDGSRIAKGRSPRHRYRYPGTYTATLTVADRRKGGLTDTVTLTVNVSNTAPTLAFTAPLNGASYAVGDVLTIDLAAADAEEGTLGDEHVTWRVLLHHLGHLHYLVVNDGATGTFAVPDHGDDSFLEIVATATDSLGAIATASVTLVPQKVAVTVDSAPAGVDVLIDGHTRTTPYTWQSIVNGSHSVTAPLNPTIAGNPYLFDSWSDGLGASHALLTPAVPLALTATYTPN